MKPSRPHRASRLANQGRYMSDEQRRAMFARMHGGASATSHEPPKTRTVGLNTVVDTESNTPLISYDPATTYKTDTAQPEPFAMVKRTRWNKGDFNNPSPSLDTETGNIMATREPDWIEEALLLLAGGAIAGELAGAFRLAGGASRLTSTAASLAKQVATPAALAATSAGINAYREAHPTIDPKTDKALALAQQISGYLAAITGLAPGKALIGKLTPSWLASAYNTVTGGVGNLLTRAGNQIAAVSPKALQTAAPKIHQIYSTVADYTGSSLTDLISTKGGLEANIKRALAITAFGTKLAVEEHQISEAQRRMEAAWAAGEDFIAPPPTERTGLETAVAVAAGTLGNPIEKQFRYGNEGYVNQVAYYRARYDDIDRRLRAGDLTTDQAQQERTELAKHKPQNMAGKAAWTIAPASAAYLAWQAQQIADQYTHTAIDRRTPGSYIDGDTINLDAHHGTNSIRLLDINAPEVAHAGMHDPNHPERTTGEVLGKEAADKAAELVGEGQYVRLHFDSHEKAAGKEVHGRQLASVETLPRPFDNLLRIPGLGRLIPAQEFQTEMIRSGLADIHYRQLSGPIDTGREHDAARDEAKAAGTGIWSAEARAQLPWVGTEKTVYERTGHNTPPPDSTVQTLLGQGLMTTGQSGAFRTMGGSGNLTAQAWNAALAIMGAQEYNAKAAYNTAPTKYPAPAGYKTEFQQQAASVADTHQARKTAPKPPTTTPTAPAPKTADHQLSPSERHAKRKAKK